MDLRKLEIFVRVADLNSFSRAAVSLNMAQPAVSIAIRKLEGSFNTRLFDRSGRQIALTAEGENLLSKVKPILADVAELSRSMGAMNDLLEGELSITCPSMLATYFLPDLLSQFLAINSRLTASVTQAGTTQVEQMLMEDGIELGVVSMDAERAAELDCVPMVDEQMILCVADQHPWAARGHVDIGELHQTPMVLYESGYLVRRKLDLMCADASVRPDIRIESNFLPLLLNMVRHNLGTTVGLRMLVAQEPDIRGVALHPVSEIRLGLAKRRGRTISRANQAFLDWLAATSAPLSGETPLVK